MRTNGLLLTESQIKRILVDVSHTTGQPVTSEISPTWNDVTRIPIKSRAFDGAPSVLLSVEMQKGRNIVELARR